MRSRLLVCSLLLITATGSARQWIKIDSVFSPSGVTADRFSSPEFCDIDNDGDADLFLGSLGADQVSFFRNIGSRSIPVYRRDTLLLRSIYTTGLPGTNAEYPLLADLDGDGDFDLIIGGFNGLNFYWNTGSRTSPVWLRDSTLFHDVNADIGNDPKPALADLDWDGDLDLVVGIGESLLGGPTAGIVMAWRNTGTPTAPDFYADQSLVTGIPDVGLNAYPVFRDLDNDGDPDLVMGRDLQTMLYFQNTGSVISPVWTAAGTIAVETKTYWKTPALCDIDGDGDFDLLYGSSDGTLFQYMNTGSPSAPVFTYLPAAFQMIRIDGSASTVSFADLDGDGDQDLISGDWLGGMQYFRNDGTPKAPKFVKTATGFSTLDVGSYSSPAAADMTGDGIPDIVCGNMSGTLSVYVNVFGAYALSGSLLTGVDVGYRSAPAMTDIDNDGDPDVLVGAEDPALMVFLRNNGGGVFAADSSLLAGITGSRDAHPFFADVDGDGDQDLLLGSAWGEIDLYRNTGSRSVPVWTYDPDFTAGLSTPQAATPACVDLDGDGTVELVTGEYSGNFTLYKRTGVTAVEQRSASRPDGIMLAPNFPNPFNPSTVITYSLPLARHIRLTVCDLLGRTVATLADGVVPAGVHQARFDAAGCSSGVYFISLETGHDRFTRKMILTR